MRWNSEHESTWTQMLETKPREIDTTQDLVALSDLQPPAPRAYVWGPLPPRPYVAIVGTRAATGAGLRAAEDAARLLAERGATIVSGGAEGIDAAAHRGALAAGGRTMVVAPVWLHHAHPKENRSLFARVLDEGSCYLTTADEEAPAHFHTFFRRNAVMMALADVAIVGDCGLRSGARNAMKEARRLGRPRYCLPWQWDEARTAGICLEMELGARPLGRVERILRDLPWLAAPDNPTWGLTQREFAERESGAARRKRPVCEGSAAPEQSAADEASLESHSRRATHPEPEALGGEAACAPLDESALALVRAVQAGAGDVDALVARTRLPVEFVQYQVALLTLQGQLVEDAGGILRYTPRPHD